MFLGGSVSDGLRTMFIALATFNKDGLLSSGFFAGIVGVGSVKMLCWEPSILAFSTTDSLPSLNGEWIGPTGESGMLDRSGSDV